MNSTLFDLFPYVYKSTDAKIYRSRSVDKTGWDEVFEPTYTAMEHSRRLIFEWIVDTFSILVSLSLCIFLWNRKSLMVSFANSITFATFSAQVLYWPFYLLSTWQTMFLLFGKTPMYSSILHCSLLRHIVLACFQSAGLITVPIAIDHICFIFRKKKFGLPRMIAVQVFITFLELFFTLAHIAVGNVTVNDICAQWIASPDVFLISMSFNNSLLLFAVLTNLTLLIVQLVDQYLMSKCVSKPLRCNYSCVLLLQSLTEFFLSSPLTARQWKVLQDGTKPVNFLCSYGYMFSFSCVFMVPLVSMLCIKQFRAAFHHLISCSKPKMCEQNKIVYVK